MTHSRNETRTIPESFGPYARAGARATRRVRDRRQETGEVTHPCLSSHWGRADRPLMDGGYAAEFGGGF